jgi:sodium/potassium-transporting ATPase subunit alpha
VVFATGDRTFIGQIANLALSAGQAEGEEDQTPLQREMKRFIIRLTIFSVISGAILFGLGFVIGYSAILNFVFAVGVITANVPEGLIVEITVCLTLTAQILSKRKVLVKFLDAVETLGATSCICSDKTGTLTMNKMTASNIWYSGRLCKADNRQKKGPDFYYEYDINDPGFHAFQEAAVVCSVANFDRSLPAERLNAVRND